MLLNNSQPNSIKVIIIGHSTGALLARKLYVVACGENHKAPFEENYPGQSQPTSWAAHVGRIILFAGMNRGWSLNHHLYTITAMLMRIGIFIGHIFQLLGYEPLAFKTRKGGSFITQLRIQWLSMLQNAQSKRIGDALTIQLLGTIDDLISPEDNIDLITGINFIYLEVPASNHMSVLKMDDIRAGKQRKIVFEAALTAPHKVLYDMQTVPADQSSIKIDLTVTDVVFVIHGIRDTGYWTQKLARRVKSAGDKEDGRIFATETSTYGYFPLISFLMPFARREKVEWLMDQYIENSAQYPNADFSFMGHSHGTYLLATALKKYPACQFKNVVFAGSVVHTKFNWQDLIQQKRITRFYNFVASSDWVVALFPKTFQTLHLQDLGSGGFDGFTTLGATSQLKYIKGGHGAATNEMYWDEIAEFLVNGQFSSVFKNLATPTRTKFMKLLGTSVPIPFLILIAIIIFGAWLIFHFTSYWSSIVLFLLLYFFVIWKVITKF